MTFRRLLPAALVVINLGFATAQDKAPPAEEVQALQKKYQEERAAALEKKFPASALERADEQAKRAEEALKAGNTVAAARFMKEARWLVPYVPTDLPCERGTGARHRPHAPRRRGQLGRLLSGRHASRHCVARLDGQDLGPRQRPRDPHLSRIEGSRRGRSPGRAMDAGSPPPPGNEIHIWDPETGKLKTSLRDTRNRSAPSRSTRTATVWRPAADDFSVRTWDIERSTEVSHLNAELDKRSKSQVYSVTYSPNGKLVAAVNGNGQLQIWNPALEPKKRQVTGLDAHPSATAYQVAFGKDTSVVFTSGSDNKAKQWIGLGPDGEHMPGHGRPTPIEGHTNNVTALAISRDGKFLATGSTDKTIRLWDMASGTARLARVYQGHSEEVSSLAFSPDGKTLASGSNDQSVRLWRVSLADEHQNFDEHTAYVWTAAFSPDGKLFADAGADKTVYIRDTSGKILHKLEGHTAPGHRSRIQRG